MTLRKNFPKLPKEMTEKARNEFLMVINARQYVSHRSVKSLGLRLCRYEVN